MAKFSMPVGLEFFDRLRKSGCYYVDKSELIYKLASNENISVALFTRPRRFGKTLTMTMLQSFFDIRRDSREVFAGLDVAKHEGFCREWMNQYPVLFISLKDVEGSSFQWAFDMLVSQIANLCKDHEYLSVSNKIDEDDRVVFEKLKSESASVSQVLGSLRTLTRMLNDYYGRPVILLIDEYDVPLAKMHDADKESKGCYKKMLDVIRGLMSNALKTNPFLKLSVITGCLRISKESIFTGVNNFATYSILDERFSDAFGFTEGEVKQILDDAGLADRLELVKSWYDGYIFGDSEVFCPWDVANYVDAAINVPDKQPDNYWKNTSSNSIIDEFVGDSKFDVSEKFEELMNGGTIEQTITDQLTYGSLKDREDNLWSVLFMTGYLTKSDQREKGRTVHLKIPNVEISSIFEEAVVRHFERSMDRNVQKEVMDALWNGEEDKVSELITDLLWDTISYHNYHENYYHAFITGIFVGQSYSVRSDQENGLGRTDIIIKDRKNRRAIIIETKKADTEKELEKMCLEGRQQIIEKKYFKGLKGYTRIICYGISFFEKTAMAKLAFQIPQSL